ncbi:MAG TPA: phage holin family protein [Gammaproteobacteria bacterium]|nr:phage holin family protein [Gammaproteobacteria bacterium]
MAYDGTDPEPAPGRTTGLLSALQRLLATFTEILHTRIEILSTELEEEGERARQLLVYGLVSLFFLGLGLLFATVFIVVAFWETHRLYVLAGFTVFYLGISTIAALVVRHKIRSRPRLFSATLSELAKDRERLTSRS